MRLRSKGSTTKHLVIGVAAGLAGAWAMNAFQQAWLKLSLSRSTNVSQQSPRNPRSDKEVMEVISSRVAGLFGPDLDERQRNVAGLVLHYGFGATTGAAYAASAKGDDRVTTGFGSAFGTLFFAAGYAVAPQDLKPCLPSEEQPKTVSAIYEWLTHVVYGVTVEATRRALVRATR